MVLDVADRQNAHSMSIAVRAIVKLFKYVKHEKELNREILTFSISHDHESVRMQGHYPLTDGEKTTFYRHPIRSFDFTSEKEGTNGRHTSSQTMSTTYGCRSTSRRFAPP